jgi:hypothetical protein
LAYLMFGNECLGTKILVTDVATVVSEDFVGTHPDNAGCMVTGAVPHYQLRGKQPRTARDGTEHNLIAASAMPAINAPNTSSAVTAAACKTTISIEFVAKPNESHRVHALLPAAITSTLEGVAGFAGCAVMASHQEERLVTVLTFWPGDLSARAATVNSGWVCKLIERYMDRRLRVQTMRTHLAIASPNHAHTARDLQRDEERVPVV